MMAQIVKGAVDAGVAACVVPNAAPYRDCWCCSGPRVGEENVVAGQTELSEVALDLPADG